MNWNVIYEKERKLAEEFFGSANNPDQIPITQASMDKLLSLSPYSEQTILDDQKEPISWIVVVPTSSEIADLFVKGKINEKELFDRTEPASHYDALYLCSAITVPEHRRKGLVKKLLPKTIELFRNKYGVKRLFAWPYSEEGRAVLESLKRQGYQIDIRQAD